MSSGGDENTRNSLLLAGRVLLASSFLPTAIGHLANISGLAVSLSYKGLPYTDFLAALIVLAETFGPLGLVLGLAPRLTASIMILATLLTTATLHRFWDFAGAARQMEQALFVAALGSIAGLLFYMASGPGGWSWQTLWRGPGGKRRPARPAKRPPSRTRSSAARPRAADEELVDAA